MSSPHPLTILLAIIACTVTSSFACSCMEWKSWDQAVQNAEFAIKMKVKEAIGPMRLNSDSTMTLVDDPYNSHTLYHIDIEEVIKDSPEYNDARKILIAANGDSLCGVKFEVGQSYKITGWVGRVQDSDLRYLSTGSCDQLITI